MASYKSNSNDNPETPQISHTSTSHHGTQSKSRLCFAGTVNLCHSIMTLFEDMTTEPDVVNGSANLDDDGLPKVCVNDTTYPRFIAWPFQDSEHKGWHKVNNDPPYYSNKPYYLYNYKGASQCCKTEHSTTIHELIC